MTNAVWSPFDRFWLSFDGGIFRHTYDEPAIEGPGTPKFIFKFEAPCYAPFITRVVQASERNVHFDIDLTPAAATQVTVLSPDGVPAVAADVGLVLSGARMALVPGGLSRDNVSGGTLLFTDSQGHFQLPPDPTITRVVAAGSQGYVDVAAAGLLANPVMRMRPWGRLQGAYVANGKPLADRTLCFQYNRRIAPGTDIGCDFNAYQTKTDADGHFVFPKVPSGVHEVALVEQHTEGGMEAWTVRPLQTVTIHAGETTTITITNSK